MAVWGIRPWTHLRDPGAQPCYRASGEVATLTECPAKRTLADKAYLDFLTELKSRIARARLSAARAVNRELLELYWDMGLAIKEKQTAHG